LGLYPDRTFFEALRGVRAGCAASGRLLGLDRTFSFGLKSDSGLAAACFCLAMAICWVAQKTVAVVSWSKKHQCRRLIDRSLEHHKGSVRRRSTSFRRILRRSSEAQRVSCQGKTARDGFSNGVLFFFPGTSRPRPPTFCSCGRDMNSLTARPAVRADEPPRL